jgi:hypothetical protein
MHYEIFKGNVTICNDQIAFQEIAGEVQVYIGTPRALEKSISKVRGYIGRASTTCACPLSLAKIRGRVTDTTSDIYIQVCNF